MAERAWLTGAPHTAELAVLVADSCQRRGVGRLLVGGLLQQCEAAGIAHIDAVTDAANSGCHALARSLGRHPPTAGNWSIRSVARGAQRHFEFTRNAEHGQPFIALGTPVAAGTPLATCR
ncbi:N-acetyltransferase family protein [Micromonospora sp. CA-240977]|uniref:GNAT family N-acetyltransferase n=1 Tax=Micromonospora sp. CA-240977 TaxID=3239957 RepID=UPI003D90A685